MNKKILSILIIVFWSVGLWANQYLIDKAHTKVGFEVTHMMISTVEGQFKEYEASFEYDEKSNILKNIIAKIDVNSIDTENQKRDNHLRDSDFFDIKKYPYMEFVSTQSIKIKPGEEKELKGKLTIKGITKDITLKVKYIGKIKDPWGNERIGFEATGKINRKDFGITWQKLLETGGVVVSDEVTIKIRGESILVK
ncbi:MAG: polyisoprenoid-binding protein [Leptospiraceae bacterium]|nr:MAG: polyisoprenoid-binding protein [Leptospiraceae bacterium]